MLRANYVCQIYHPSIRCSHIWNIPNNVFDIHPIKVHFLAVLFVDILSIKVNIAFIGSGNSGIYCIRIRWFNFDMFAACATICKISRNGWLLRFYNNASFAWLISWAYLFFFRKSIDHPKINQLQFHPAKSFCKFYRLNNFCRCYISLLWEKDIM